MKQYLITDPLYYTSDKNKFEVKLREVLQKNPTIDTICFRDKISKNFEELAFIFMKVAKEFNIENIYLNTDYHLAYNLGATGVHLTSSQFNKIKEAKDLKLDVIVSCHNMDDIDKAQKSYVNAITYSPIFEVEGKDSAKGVNKLKEVVSLYEDLDIYALGGITSDEQVKQIEKTKVYGFASIRYFV